MKLYPLGTLLLLALSSCASTPSPMEVRVVASAHEVGWEPRQIYVEADVNGDLFPKIITLADHEASIFVGEGEVGHETGQSLRVTCVEDRAHLTLIEHRNGKADREVWSGTIPIEAAPTDAAQ